MSQTLERRIARLERARHGRGDWRQFGDDPRDKPDWALVAAILWELESNPNFRNCAELIEVRRLYDAGEIDAAFNLLAGFCLYRASRRELNRGSHQCSSLD
jgi:hypothetical protein